MNTKILTRAAGLSLGLTILATATASASEHIVNGDFSQGNTGFSTAYTYVPSGPSTTPSTYGIRTSSQDFNPGYTEFHDHTTGTGNMMLVDGYGTPATVWSETVNVAANSEFKFSAYATTADPDNPPALQFFFNGTQQGGGFQLTTAGVYQNFTGFVYSGSGTSLTISIVDPSNIGTQADGNDFALDDISLVDVPEPATFFHAGILGILLTGEAVRRKRGVAMPRA